MSRASICLLLLAVVPITASVHAAVSPGVKCAAAKQKAAVKKIAAKLKCHQKAATTGDPVDSDCLAAAEEKFNAAVAKANAKGGCARTGDASAIEIAADRCVADIRTETPTEPPTCGATAYPQCGGSCPPGQQCQAIIETRFADSAGSCTPVADCTTSCVCRNIDTACNGQPCDQICTADSRCAGMGHMETTESCCSGDLGPCVTSGSPVCCCSGSCLQLVGGLGACQAGPVCNASGTDSVCQGSR